MKTPEELRQIAQNASIEKAIENDENAQKAVDHFLEDLETYANMGRFERKTTCLVHKSGNKFFCQTGNGGEGFVINNINLMIAKIEQLGFKVNFSRKTGYCPLTISWK